MCHRQPFPNSVFGVTEVWATIHLECQIDCPNAMQTADNMVFPSHSQNWALSTSPNSSQGALSDCGERRFQQVRVGARHSPGCKSLHFRRRRHLDLPPRHAHGARRSNSAVLSCMEHRRPQHAYRNRPVGIAGGKILPETTVCRQTVQHYASAYSRAARGPAKIGGTTESCQPAIYLAHREESKTDADCSFVSEHFHILNQCVLVSICEPCTIGMPAILNKVRSVGHRQE
jgi:hypothetical protein